MPESPAPNPKNKLQFIKEFIKKNPKKVAAITLAIMSFLPQESRDLLMAVLDAILQSAI